MKLKFRAGDKVRVKSLEWYNENKDEDGDVRTPHCAICFKNYMTSYLGKILTIKYVKDSYYIVEEDSSHWMWTDWMLEDEVVIDKIDTNFQQIVGEASAAWNESITTSASTEQCLCYPKNSVIGGYLPVPKEEEKFTVEEIDIIVRYLKAKGEL